MGCVSGLGRASVCLIVKSMAAALLVAVRRPPHGCRCLATHPAFLAGLARSMDACDNVSNGRALGTLSGLLVDARLRFRKNSLLAAKVIMVDMLAARRLALHCSRGPRRDCACFESSQTLVLSSRERQREGSAHAVARSHVILFPGLLLPRVSSPRVIGLKRRANHLCPGG